MPEPELLGYKPAATEAGQGQLLNGADWHPPGGNGQLQQNGANGIPVKKKEFLSDPDIDTRPTSTADPDKVNFKNGRVSPTAKSDKDDKEKDKEKKEPEKMVGFFEVFKFSTCVDKLLMIFGSIFALAHGAALPAMIIVFGDMTDLFVESGMFEQLMNDIRSYLPTLGYTYQQVFDNPLLLNNNRTAIQAQVNYTIDWNWLNVQDQLLDEMKKFAIYYIAIAGGVMVCGYVQVSFWAVAAERQAHRIRDMFLRNVLRQEIGWFDTHETGELNTRLSDDINKIHEGIGDKMGSCLQWTSGFLTGFIIGFIYGWKLTLVILAISPLLAITGFVMNKLVADMSSKESEAYAKAGAIAEEVFSSIRTVVSFGGQKKECQRYNSHLQNAKDVGIRKGYTNGFSVGLVYVVMFGAYALGFWYGAKLVREESDNYTIGKVLIIFFSVLIGAWSIGNVAPPLQSLASARGAAYVVFDIIKLVPEIDSYSEVGTKPDKVTGSIQFRNVKFTYPARKEVQVLKGVDLTVQPGQTVALVGSSGCGKSTCVQLMTRFYDPEDGTITLDGNNLKDLNVKWLREHIGIVSQEPILFAMSIKDNIRMGRNNVTDDEVIAATKMANAYNFIMDLPEKFNTLVGERGAQLSGGQKQRVAIARALVRDPKILLLDEATSALDTESESIVQEALDKARAGRTTLVIAHRLSTIKNADIIAGFKDGVIVEQGTHDQLMARNGVYNSLVTLQTKKVDVEEEELIKEYTEGIKKTDDKKLHRMMSTLSDGKSAALEKQESVTDKKKKKGKKGDKEEKEKKPDVGFGRIIRYNSPEWPYILVGCIAACLNGGVQPAFAVIFAELIGVFAEQDQDKQEKEVLMYCLILLGIGVAGFIGFFLQGAMFGRSGENLTMRIRKNTFRAMIRQDISWYDDHKNATGALTTRLAVDASQVQGAAGARLGSLVQNVANMGTALVISFIYGWQLTLVIIAFLPAIAVGGALQMKILNGVAGQNKEALEEAGKIATEGVENIRTVASLTREDRIHDIYLESLRGPYQAALKKAHVAGFAFSFSQSVIFFAYAGAFFFGAYMIKEGEMDFVDVFKVFSAIVFGAMALGQASAFAPDAAKAQASSEVIFPLLDTTPTIDAESENGEKPHAETVTSTVTFRDCKFRYPTRPDVEVLQGLSLTVDPGQTLALVGTSGCGKSTTVALIERFYDVEAGSVLLDQYNVKDLNVPWLRSQIGIVSQEPILFDCSIRDNIAYGDNSRTPSMDEIIKAARNANIHEFISSLPDGYDTNVGDKGTQLSGGQKQRVAIARALLRNPKILLLDEATSALDTESEKIVQEALDKARAGRTCIVIAHRLSTIQNADKICVIKHGTVSEEGKHNDLMAKQGIYYKLNMAQKRQK
ncbi:ATP-dependent translocase ABCB1-like isoform X5 [Mytilus californianus]|uniref:ATP-dependent translocase ABCB1-like isoform X5 n=1 Tax=Mytilus californianus TaxID=6549 RepID=UPI002244FD82|nr:ATP-dependent translocase ABCB1-like isoform X5 [Mytilus californianus]